MTADRTMEVATTVIWCITIPCIAYLVIRFLVIEYQMHRNSKAPVFTERVTVFYKHPERKMPVSARACNEIYYITFHTDYGQQVKLYMTYEHFYILNEGDTGMLTWQGDRFWKFLPEQQKGA